MKQDVVVPLGADPRCGNSTTDTDTNPTSDIMDIMVNLISLVVYTSLTRIFTDLPTWMFQSIGCNVCLSVCLSTPSNFIKELNGDF